MRAETFWRIYAQQYDPIWDSPLIDALRARIHAEVASAGRILDLGCGTGLLARPRPEGDPGPVRAVDSDLRVGPGSDRPHPVWLGADTSIPMLERALERGRIDEALHADAAAVPIPSDSVDAVVSANLLQFHPDAVAVITEALRVLRPGGTLVLAWPVDALAPATVWRAERASGRRWLSRLQARARRIGVSALAGTVRDLGARPRHDDEITHALDVATGVAGAEVVGLTTWREVQRLAVVRAAR
ncbi:class I SAM-dependent methyltransferase [Litorihabitans aurantiacus]|uniref:Methyltransferase type 11 domain-containing protein n=1 Tax=Litorihabitans aurantiacus TaxID=1930061 RepID=A0AA37XHN1_9MICO|nr:class I SAM-dependent methyltransferase [Litorihabitans aurantiacus]GMA33052.1 hypothetical protein GCM10025875_30440 [Litorihabitans aurantiacus]